MADPLLRFEFGTTVMPVHNSDIADAFEKVADLLEIRDANRFRIRAYREAARTVSSLSGDVVDLLDQGEDLTQYAGIGDDLAAKIEEIAQSGSLSMLEKLERDVPGELTRIMELPGLGPKRTAALYRKLEVSSLEALEDAAREGHIAELEGFGEKTQNKILREVEQIRERGGERERWQWIRAEERAQPLVEYLRGADCADQVVVAGSFRRREETVGDLDILATCDDPEAMMDAVADYEDVVEVVSQGKTRTSVVLRGDLQVDLRVVDPEAYGAALHYFTGSKAHNIAVRKRGQQRDLKINEYGVFRDDERVGGATEQEVFAAVELDYVEPELRQDRGEIEAAERGELPDCIDDEALRGDLHMHTTATDGRNSLEKMAEAAREMGHEYIAITDHSQNVSMANGLDEDRLYEQIDAIDRLNDELDDLRVLKSIEVDILADGSLDLSDEALQRLDLTVCSVHYDTDLSKQKMTERILRAMDNQHFNILGHPTGRLIQRRRPYEIDMERVLHGAAERGCVVEINAQPRRLDLHDMHARLAREMGVKIAISTDSHSTNELRNLRLGVAQARRGWLEADDVVNTRCAADLLKLLRR